jgi:hypothetical protein
MSETHTEPSAWIVPKRIRRPRGARAGALEDIQLICGAGPYELDILVREHDGPTQLEIVGQVTLAGRVYEPVPNLRLQLIEAHGEYPVQQARTDDFGEFDLASRAKRSRYGLRVGDASDAPCVLVWEGIAT